ncbi:DUF2007 domain-containing protein [bacterium]|nr:DUF2007 domain-containing protein [bacterium]
MKLVTIDREFDVMHAELLRSRLEAAGFHPVIQGEDAALTGLGTATMGPVRLQVPMEEAEEAIALVKDFDSGKEDSAE